MSYSRKLDEEIAKRLNQLRFPQDPRNEKACKALGFFIHYGAVLVVYDAGAYLDIGAAPPEANWNAVLRRIKLLP